MSDKCGVVRTLLDRAETVVSEVEDKKEECAVKEALTTCNYPPRTIKEVEKQKMSDKKERNKSQKEKMSSKS